ncbi:MAG: prolipoprotein diacylglyceryl transferase, partial [Nitrospiraceae bacterium]
LAGWISMGQALSLPMLALGLFMIWLVQREQSRQS